MAITQSDNKFDISDVTKVVVGLGNVENYAPADMPVSDSAQTALNTKANQATTYTKTEISNKF